MRRLFIVTSVWLLAMPALALVPYDDLLQVSNPNVTTGEFFLGAGVGGFTSNLGSASSVGVNWTIRGGINTHRFFGAELNYQGTSSSVNTMVSSSGTTVSGSYFAEQQITADLKLQYPVTAGDQLVTPYVVAGFGYAHIGVDSSLASLGYPTSNAAAFPLGAGLSYVVAPGLVLDARYTYNVLTTSLGNTWNVGFNLGAIFGS